MSETSLIKKLKLKPRLRAAIVSAPEGYLDVLNPLPEGVTIAGDLAGLFDWVQVFVRNRAEMDPLVPTLVAVLKPESLLWICFPKGSSQIQTDLTRDKGWEAFQGIDLKWTNLISVDETWSAFSLRPYRPGEARKSFR